MKNPTRSLLETICRAFRGACLAAAVAATQTADAARNATVAASLSQDGTAFTASFAGHASETNSLWVVYGASDMGSGTNGWAHVERLGTVLPGTASWTCAAPAGWGDTVKALRFVLSEVPYDYDYSLSYVNNSANKQRIVLDDFEFYANYRVCMQVRTTGTSSANNGAFFSNRAGAGNVTPKFTLFAIGKTTWRLDYNSTDGTGVSGVAVNQDYSIAASSAGLYVNGSEIKTLKGTAATTKSQGSLEFFCANQYAGTMSNMGLAFNLYGAQVYNAPTGGKLIVNLVPMVKAGVAGMYDTLHDKFYFSDTGTELAAGTRIENANPFFTSALYAVVAEGPTVFTPASATADATNYDNPDGGILNGTATLTLSGANNWGGLFTVSNGTLVADFGQGLGSADNLLLSPSEDNGLTGTFGGYGGWNGRATATIGNGAGQLRASNGYLAWCAPDGGELAVNVGGESAPFQITSDCRRFLFNGAAGAGTLTFENPMVANSAVTNIIRAGFGTVKLAGNVNGSEMAVETYNLSRTSVADDGELVFAGSANSFPLLTVKTGTTRIAAGASMTNGTLIVGSSFSQSGSHGDPASLVIDGDLYLDENVGDAYYGSMTVYGSTSTITINDGATVNLSNLNFHRRNILQNGGTVTSRGSYGLNSMGAQGTARYTLSGGTLNAPCAIQAASPSAVAQFVFNGGTLATTARTPAVFFQDFTNSASYVQATIKGGTFRVNRNTSITNAIGNNTSSGSSWNYAAADWLAAPAFVKTGTATLTLSGTSTYRCATDVAEGTLALAGGGVPGVLPATGVVRLTGGTLDLGGNAQTVRALLGTAGAVVNGSIAATEGIYPGGAGTVGSFAGGAALSGTLYIDVDAETGACDSIAAASGATLDLSALDLVLPETIPSGVERLTVASGATTGAFHSVANLPDGWEIATTPLGTSARKINAFTLIIR